jgi:radical SAM-linked protein
MRIRISFWKTEAMRFTGHLDLFKTWERTLRRARLPLAYSQGFHPQPRINLACALPLGFTSQCELVDIWLDDDIDQEAIHSALEPALPPGIRVTKIEVVQHSLPSMQSLIQSAEYRITLLDNALNLDENIRSMLMAETLPRSRRNKSYDLRPLIEVLERLLDDPDGNAQLLARLSARDGATGRPEELVEALGFSALAARYHRMRLFIAEPEATSNNRINSV